MFFSALSYFFSFTQFSADFNGFVDSAEFTGFSQFSNFLSLTFFFQVDLIPPELAVAWKTYFQEKYSNIHVNFFTSCPAYNLRNSNSLRLRGKISMAKEGALEICQTVKKILGQEVDLSAWEKKISGENSENSETQDGFITIGMVGHPNVGKSSLINSLMGKRVVSVSKTPGHTKHFQTIFVTPSVRFCDCPGLVFPSLSPRPFQVKTSNFLKI